MHTLKQALPWLPGLAGSLLFLLLSASGMAGKSATYDEAVHLLSGWRVLTEGDHDFNHEHPPLMKALAAAPAVVAGAAKPIEPWSYRKEFDEWPLSHGWLYHVNDGDRLLRLGRLPIAIIGAALALLVFAVARSLAGPAAGAAAVSLFALEPNLLAHGSLVTTDMGMAALFFATTAAFQRWTATRSRTWLVVSGVAWGAALLAKFTSILLAPVLILLAILDARRRRRETAPAVPAVERASARSSRERKRAEVRAARSGTAPPSPWKRAAVALGAIAGVALVVLNAGYGFDRSFTPLRGMTLESQAFRERAAGPAGAIPLPVPAPWVAGFDHAEAGGQRWWSYFMGRHSMTGWRSYYLVALLVKTPIPLLLLVIAGLILWRRAGAAPEALASIAIPPALLLASFTLSGNLKNIGVRYILPVHPFLCVLGGVAAAALWRWPRPWGKAAVVILLAWMAVGAWSIYPDHLAYFNEIAGGPEGGRWWLLDSNLDWGQDLKGLGEWMRANRIDSIYLDYFGRACPRYYGIRTSADFTGGWIAVSATNLAGVYRDDKSRYDFLRGVAPAAAIGHSILVYNVPRPPSWTPLPGGTIE